MSRVFVQELDRIVVVVNDNRMPHRGIACYFALLLLGIVFITVYLERV